MNVRFLKIDETPLVGHVPVQLVVGHQFFKVLLPHGALDVFKFRFLPRAPVRHPVVQIAQKPQVVRLRVQVAPLALVAGDVGVFHDFVEITVPGAVPLFRGARREVGCGKNEKILQSVYVYFK